MTNKVTSLNRPLDFNYPTNTFIAGAAIITFIAGIIIQISLGNEILTSVIWGFQAAFSVFIAWALSREIDPDYPSSAVLAALLQVMILLVSSPGNIVFQILLLGLTRMISRTTGGIPTVFDSAGLTLITGIIALAYYPIAGVIAGLAFAFDAFLIRKNQKNIIFAIISIVLAILGYFLIHREVAGYDIDGFYKVLAPVTALIFCIKLISTKSILSFSDVGTYKIDAIRVQASQFIALIAAISLFWIYGVKGFDSLSSVWSAMAASGLYMIYRLIIKIFRK